MKILAWYSLIISILEILIVIGSDCNEGKWRIIGALIGAPVVIFIANYLFR